MVGAEARSGDVIVLISSRGSWTKLPDGRRAFIPEDLCALGSRDRNGHVHIMVDGEGEHEEMQLVRRAQAALAHF